MEGLETMETEINFNELQLEDEGEELQNNPPSTDNSCLNSSGYIELSDLLKNHVAKYPINYGIPEGKWEEYRKTSRFSYLEIFLNLEN